MYQKFQFFSDEAPISKDLDTDNQNEGDDEEGGGAEGLDEPFFPIDPNKVRVEKVRLDKWLWAARFFKTRPLARIEVEAGNVLYNGEQTKPNREIELNAVLKIRQRRCERTVIIRGLSTRRRSKDEALLLFEETSESKQARDRQQETWQPRSDFQASSSPFSFSPQGNTDQERRPVRFLRRSFGRNASLPASQQPSSHHSQPSYPAPHHPHHQQPQYPSPYQQNHQQPPRYQPPRYPAQTQAPYPAPPSQRYPASPYPASPYPRTQKPPRHQAPQKPRNPQYVDQEFVEPLE